jgi:hypothetical protein
MTDNTFQFNRAQLVDACYAEPSLVQYRSRLNRLAALGCRASYAGLERRVFLGQKIAFSTFTQTVNAASSGQAAWRWSSSARCTRRASTR